MCERFGQLPSAALELEGFTALCFDEAMHYRLICESLKAAKDAEYESEVDALWRDK
jgi:hypothetical protein